MDDTESYHIQMVKWIKEYGTVPGLVHLHERFGFNSSWFSSIAMFSPLSGNLNYYTHLNGVLSLWFFIYLALLISNREKNSSHLSSACITVLTICIISWPLMRGNASTSNYDYITLLVIFVLFTETFRLHSSIKKFPFFSEWLIWPAYLFTVRITNFPLLVLAAFAIIFLWKRNEQTKIFFCCCVSLLLIIPFLARNVILSGYAFYPSMHFDWFPVDWKANKNITEELLRFIKYFNRVNTGLLPLETTEAMNFPQWIAAWMKYMFGYDKIVFIPGMLGLVSGPFFLNRIKPALSSTTGVFILIISLQILVWFIVAPDPRFIYGCLLCGILLLSLTVLSFTGKKIKTVWSSISLLVLAVALAGFAVLKAKEQGKSINMLLPARLPQPPTQTVIVDSITISIPEKILNNWNPRCYATKLPCAYHIDPKVRARGHDIKRGFRTDNEEN